MRIALALLVLLGSLSVSGSWFDEVTALAEQEALLQAYQE